MFQSFAVTARPEQGPPRLAELRSEMSAAGLDGFLVPRADVHQGEYVTPRDARLAWLTGFTGSAGFCCVLRDVAGVFVDGRYRTQVKAQVADVFTPVPWPETRLSRWLPEHAPKNGSIGFDMWLHTADEIEKLTEALAEHSLSLVPHENLVDRIWRDQPANAVTKTFAQPIEFAGETHESKRARIAKALRLADESHAVLTQPDSICWLLNLRGQDIAHNPVMQGYAIVRDDATVDLFAHPGKLDDVRDHLGTQVRLHSDRDFPNALRGLTGTVRVDPKTVPFAVITLLEAGGATISRSNDPCSLPKARKNAAEIAGTVEAHLRDGAAMVTFLAWLDAQAPGTLRETQVVTQLETCRRQGNALRDISFETIAGTGPNGAIMHYRVTEETDRILENGHLLVLDSGGQYPDGTTDITRTIAIGDVGADERAAFTRVLLGMIAMSCLRWPKGLAGRDIEAIGRVPLWLAGQDFNHGLGHGVGVYLSVHEGPQRLSRLSHVPLEPGMILSNEPGYYREGAFGIRIENLLVVQEAPRLPGGDDERAFLNWQTLAFVPVDRRLIDSDMLGRDARAWLNAYHAEVAEKIGPRVGKAEKLWLDAATQPL